jgi:hypothetical protein
METADTFSEFHFVSGGEENNIMNDELISNASQILAEQDVKMTEANQSHHMARLGRNGASPHVESALGGKLVGKFDISAVNPHIDAVSMNESIWTVTNNARADWAALVDLDETTLPPFHPVPLILTTAVTSSGKDAGTSSFTWNGTASLEISPPLSNQEATFIAIQVYGRSTSGSSYANLILSDEDTNEQIATFSLIAGNERVGQLARKGYGIIKVFEIPRFSSQKRVSATVSVLKLRRSDTSSIVIGFGSPTVFVANRATKYTPVWTADISPHENEGLFLTVLPPRNSFIPSNEVKAVVVPLGVETPVRRNGGAVPNMRIVLNSVPANHPHPDSGVMPLEGEVGSERILSLDFDPKLMAFPPRLVRCRLVITLSCQRQKMGCVLLLETSQPFYMSRPSVRRIPHGDRETARLA